MGPVGFLAPEESEGVILYPCAQEGLYYGGTLQLQHQWCALIRIVFSDFAGCTRDLNGL